MRRLDSALTAREHWHRVKMRHEQQDHSPWRPWVKAAGLFGIVCWLIGSLLVQSAADESPGWWFAAWVLLAGVAIMLLVAPVSLIDFWRDGRDLITYVRLIRQERRQDHDR